MYKIIHENKVIDVVKYPEFIRFLNSGHIAITDETSAHGIVGSDNTIYTFAARNNQDLKVVTIEKISSKEFNRLLSLLNSGEVVDADMAELAKVKRTKLTTLSDICKNKIISGFTITLSDGERYNFRLTTEDQLNLIQIESQLACGENYFIYHATNQPCKRYTREDMLKVIKAFRYHILYHTTYFNAAKQYINSLTSTEHINMFTYGTDISDTVDDPVLRQVIKNGGILQ